MLLCVQAAPAEQPVKQPALNCGPNLCRSNTPCLQAGAAAAAAAGGAAAEIEHFRIDMPPGCASGGPAAETAEKLLHLLALLKLNLVQRKVSSVPARVADTFGGAAAAGQC